MPGIFQIIIDRTCRKYLVVIRPRFYPLNYYADEDGFSGPAELQFRDAQDCRMQNF